MILPQSGRTCWQDKGPKSCRCKKGQRECLQSHRGQCPLCFAAYQANVTCHSRAWSTMTPAALFWIHASDKTWQEASTTWFNKTSEITSENPWFWAFNCPHCQNLSMVIGPTQTTDVDSWVFKTARLASTTQAGASKISWAAWASPNMQEHPKAAALSICTLGSPWP